MIVRCGRCRIELEVAGPGEFACPACGTRNMVGGTAPQGPALDLPDLGRTTPASPPEQTPGVRWTACPQCSYRFAVGEVASVTCPACSAGLSIDDQGAATIS
ncbi:MAG: hypothetical protein WDA27_11230 [Actinomycetota bacterium]